MGPAARLSSKFFACPRQFGATRRKGKSNGCSACRSPARRPGPSAAGAGAPLGPKLRLVQDGERPASSPSTRQASDGARPRNLRPRRPGHAGSPRRIPAAPGCRGSLPRCCSRSLLIAVYAALAGAMVGPSPPLALPPDRSPRTPGYGWSGPAIPCGASPPRSIPGVTSGPLSIACRRRPAAAVSSRGSRSRSRRRDSRRWGQAEWRVGPTRESGADPGRTPRLVGQGIPAPADRCDQDLRG